MMGHSQVTPVLLVSTGSRKLEVVVNCNMGVIEDVVYGEAVVVEVMSSKLGSVWTLAMEMRNCFLFKSAGLTFLKGTQ